ncbi:hypothetical protein JOB18_018136 [Solea senegalensis]|uniref:Uncharacterized protein n=1 Tax=Solea senegalensis TaxID=28829 RepID=A0AAV6T5Y3_SOLSE|nr:hypothetical protein JOB18_018136 [Solea senegalensis]
MIFGRGTRLNIDSNDKYAPSYFYLENQQSSACLAAGFSPHNATLTHQLFKKDPTKAEPVQISGDSLFNQVALVSEGQGDTCDPNRNKTSVCAGTLDKDPTVNSVTLIVLALRLLFFKTVVFNVLMTLRLWMSLSDFTEEIKQGCGDDENKHVTKTTVMNNLRMFPSQEVNQDFKI